MIGEVGQDRVLALDGPLDLRATLGPLRQGPKDACVRWADGGLWWATRTPEGPATVFVRSDPPAGRVAARAWGPGAGWALDGLPGLVGADDDRTGFDPASGPYPLVAELARRHPGLRIPRTRAVTEFLVPTILAQKVTGVEAKRSYRELVEALGEPAPGAPGRARGLRVPPAPAVLAATPSWVFHRCGVERKRADTIRRACAVAGRMEEAVGMDRRAARARLAALPGLGPWTAAEVALVALGDADAVSIGDFHLKNQMAWALAGQARGDDATMLALLEPYRGHRGRVVRLIVSAGITAPRFGPKLATRQFRWS
ncbi:MAG: DNA-3-methyladenine glycosylase family protein [Acidimicrobiales bacterium]